MATAQMTHQGSLLPVLDEGKPDATGWLYRRVFMGALWALLVIVALLLGPSEALQLSRALIFVIVGFSINMLIGYAGQVSLGHAAFVGVGAFTSALIVGTDSAASFWIAIFVAMATGGIAALALGIVALRLKGLYLALVTLAYGTITEVVIFGIPALTGGGAGAQTVRPPGFDSNGLYALLCLAFVGAVFYLDKRFTSSKVGRSVVTIQENEIVAASFGINVVSYKLLVFVASGALAGLAGALEAHRLGSIAPSDFSFALSLTFVLMVVVGGLRSRGGIFIGSMFFAVLPYLIERMTFLHHWFPTEVTPHLPVLIGAMLLLVTLIQFPGGIGQQISPVVAWLHGKPFSLKHHHESSIQTGGAGVRP